MTPLRRRLLEDMGLGNAGQVLCLLRSVAVAQMRAHDSHLRVAGRAFVAAGLDFLQDRRRRGEAHARTAVLLGNQAGQLPRPGERAHELGRI